MGGLSFIHPILPRILTIDNENGKNEKKFLVAISNSQMVIKQRGNKQLGIQS